MEEAPGGGRGEVVADRHGASAHPEDGDAILVATKEVDVLLDPGESHLLVPEALVTLQYHRPWLPAVSQALVTLQYHRPW